MKSLTLLLTFLFISCIGYSQSFDILVVPKQQSFIVSYTSEQKIGAYIGGYYITDTNKYTFVTPVTLWNRAGLVYGNEEISLMAGIFNRTHTDFNPKLDIWVRINPFRILVGKQNSFDISLGINYSEGINYGVGFSIK